MLRKIQHPKSEATLDGDGNAKNLLQGAMYCRAPAIVFYRVLRLPPTAEHALVCAQPSSLEPPMRAPAIKNRAEDAGTNTGRHKQTKTIQIPIYSGRGRADIRSKRPARILSPIIGVVVPSTEFFTYNLDRIGTIPHKDNIGNSTLVCLLLLEPILQCPRRDMASDAL